MKDLSLSSKLKVKLVLKFIFKVFLFFVKVFKACFCPSGCGFCSKIANTRPHLRLLTQKFLHLLLIFCSVSLLTNRRVMSSMLSSSWERCLTKDQTDVLINTRDSHHTPTNRRLNPTLCSAATLSRGLKVFWVTTRICLLALVIKNTHNAQ